MDWLVTEDDNSQEQLDTGWSKPQTHQTSIELLQRSSECADNPALNSIYTVNRGSVDSGRVKLMSTKTRSLLEQAK